MKIIPLNPEPNGMCRTIKAQYYRNSLNNFLRGGGYGATGVIVLREDCGADMEIKAKRNGV